MSAQDREYHHVRERQCREMAAHAASPDIRRLHEELARLHELRASRAERTLVLVEHVAA